MRIRNIFRSKTSRNGSKDSSELLHKPSTESSTPPGFFSKLSCNETKLLRWFSTPRNPSRYEKLEEDEEKVRKETALPWGCHDVCYYTFACPVPIVIIDVLVKQQ
jgi:hypothetical protein